MTKILFIVLPYGGWSGISKARKDLFTAFPYGVLSIATYLKKNSDAECRIIDCNVSDDYRKEVQDSVYTFNPDVIALSMMFDTSYKYMPGIMELLPHNRLIVMGGAAAIASYKEILDENPRIDAVCYGEGEVPFLALAVFGKGVLLRDAWWATREKSMYHPIKAKVEHLDEVIDLDYSFVDIDKYSGREAFSPFASTEHQRQFYIITSRGCPFKCLSGNTLIDTTEGKFKIKDLVGQTPKVLTRDPVTKDPLYVKATIVAKTDTDQKLLRVSFKEGGYLDCTPDHNFITFKNGNQRCEIREYEKPASELKKGDSLRAIHYAVTKQGYVDIVWGRCKRARQHKLVMEATINRKLVKGEHIHHNDKDKLNNAASNLTLTNPHDHNSTFHPEVSQRMKDNNPAKNLPHEFYVKCGIANRGKKRTFESRVKYRLSKLGTKNPNYIDGHSVGQPSRVKGLEVNHVVKDVEYLPDLEDTYCMEVPGYDWFYANDVLVHNCTFCMNSENPDKSIRYASVDAVIAHVDKLVNQGMKILTFYDDQILFNKKRAKELFRRLIPYHLKIECPNGLSVAFIDDELAGLMKEAGMTGIKLAIESGDPYVLNEIMNKPLKVGMVKPVVEILHKHGFWVQGFFVVGMPGETDTHRYHTQEFIKDVGLDWAQINTACPVRGSLLYRECLEKGYIQPHKVGEFAFKEYCIEQPDYPVEHIRDEAYRMNLDVNFVNNRNMKEKQYWMAVLAFKDVLTLVPDHAFAYYYLSVAYGKLGEYDEAVDALSKYSRIVAKDPFWKRWSRQFGLMVC